MIVRQRRLLACIPGQNGGGPVPSPLMDRGFCKKSQNDPRTANIIPPADRGLDEPAAEQLIFLLSLETLLPSTPLLYTAQTSPPKTLHHPRSQRQTHGVNREGHPLRFRKGFPVHDCIVFHGSRIVRLHPSLR